MELTQEELEFLGDSLQRDAVGLLQAGCTQDHPAYLANRKLYGKVWDVLEPKGEGDL